MTIEQNTQEAVDRLRRIETRLTAYLVKNGETVKGQAQPYWSENDECVVVPHLDCSLSKCMGIIPADLSGDVYIRTEDHEYIATIHIGGEK
jgi:hypothetical protein